MKKQTDCKRYKAIANRIAADEEIIATNKSFYFTDAAERNAIATVTLNKRIGELSIEIKRDDVMFTPFGTRKDTSVLYSGNLGTLDKPRLSNLPGILKKYGYGGAGMTAPFKRKWTSSFGSQLGLKEIIESYKKRIASKNVIAELLRVAKMLLAKEYRLKRIYHPTHTFLVLRWLAEFPHGRFTTEGAKDAASDIMKAVHNDLNEVKSKSSIEVRNPGERNIRIDENGSRVYFDIMHRTEVTGDIYNRLVQVLEELGFFEYKGVYRL